MGGASCSSCGMGSTGESRRNGSGSLVKQDAVGDGSEAIRINKIVPLEIYSVTEPALPVLEGGWSTASAEFTSDRYIRTPATLTLSTEVIFAFRSNLPEYRRKLGEQCSTMNDDWAVVI